MPANSPPITHHSPSIKSDNPSRRGSSPLVDTFQKSKESAATISPSATCANPLGASSFLLQYQLVTKSLDVTIAATKDLPPNASRASISQDISANLVIPLSSTSTKSIPVHRAQANTNLLLLQLMATQETSVCLTQANQQVAALD